MNINYGSLVNDRNNEQEEIYYDAITDTDADTDADANVNEKLLALVKENEIIPFSYVQKDSLLVVVNDWLYSSQVPPELQLLRKENVAIPLCYLLVGTIEGLSGPILGVYPLDLGATEAQQTTMSILLILPASLKIIFGFLSDNFPIFGYRRKPYMILDWILTSLSYGILLLTTDLSLSKNDDDDDDEEIVVPQNAPSILFLSLMTFLFSTEYWLADVMGDSIVAEKTRLEPSHIKGTIQSSCYSYRFFGYMICGPILTALYKLYNRPIAIVTLLSVLPLLMIPFILLLNEKRYQIIPSTYDQCQEMWTTVCSRAVWQPLSFVYIYNALQIGNGAWNQYLRTVLHFTSTQLNLIIIVSGVLLYVGVVAYKTYMITWSWRLVYIITTIINLCFSIMQLSLIANIRFGLSPFFFALGYDALSTFIMGIQFLPVTIMVRVQLNYICCSFIRFYRL